MSKYQQTPRSAQDIFAGGLEMFWDVVPESHVLSCLTLQDVAQLRVVAHLMGQGFFAVRPRQGLILQSDPSHDQREQ